MSRVTLSTSHGDIVVELADEDSPATVANVLQYVRDGHYDGTIFHRVIDGFMIQGGGFAPGMKEKKTKDPIKNEASNGISNARGTLAMARTPDPDSATAQFFVNVKDNDFLNAAAAADGNGYAVFGKVVAGTDVVDQIEKVATGRKGFHDDVPNDDVVILKAVEVT